MLNLFCYCQFIGKIAQPVNPPKKQRAQRQTLPKHHKHEIIPDIFGTQVKEKLQNKKNKQTNFSPSIFEVDFFCFFFSNSNQLLESFHFQIDMKKKTNRPGHVLCSLVVPVLNQHFWDHYCRSTNFFRCNNADIVLKKNFVKISTKFSD